MDNRRPTWAEIDLKAIKNNLRGIKDMAFGTKVMVAVKADAYGHGMLEVVRVCIQEGIDYLGVATLDEALLIRRAGIKVPILVLGYVPDEYARIMVEKDIAATVFSIQLARRLSIAAVELSKNASVHIKIETGMGRLGLFPDNKTLDIISEISTLPGIYLEGIFTHFAVADIKDKTFTLEQTELFKNFIISLEERDIIIPLKHCANSAAIMEVPEAHFNMVRAGIVIYGLYPSDEVDKNRLMITPAMTLKSRISFIKDLDAGATISYGRTYRCSRKTRVATVPIGYADGYTRLLSNRAHAVIKGHKVPLIGTICMDQCMVDISEVKDAAIGDEVILFGKPEDGVTADDLARSLGTISYEIVCSVGSRVPRIYKQVSS
jgi:alanine racemase